MNGHPRLAKLQDSNDSFCIFRRFGPPAKRILLHKQIEIERLVKKLHELDAFDEKDDILYWRLKSTTTSYKGWNSSQKELMDELEIKLLAYCEEPEDLL